MSGLSYGFLCDAFKSVYLSCSYHHASARPVWASNMSFPTLQELPQTGARGLLCKKFSMAWHITAPLLAEPSARRLTYATCTVRAGCQAHQHSRYQNDGLTAAGQCLEQSCSLLRRVWLPPRCWLLQAGSHDLPLL